jgi:hypothetical protein
MQVQAMQSSQVDLVAMEGRLRFEFGIQRAAAQKQTLDGGAQIAALQKGLVQLRSGCDETRQGTRAR